MSLSEHLAEATAAARAQLNAVPLITRAMGGDVTRAEYLRFLGEAYHHVSHTVPLLMACGARVPPRLGWLRDAMAHYIAEESGHEQWILDDIAAAGGDAEAVRTGTPLPATELMVSYAYDTIARRNPAGFLGMVYVLEGTSTQLALRAARAIRERLGLPPTAFSYLESHGSVDLEHVQFLAGLLDRLDGAGERAAVVHAANMFFHLYADIFRTISH